VTIKKQKEFQRGEQSTQPWRRVEGKLPLGLVENSRAKNSILHQVS